MGQDVEAMIMEAYVALERTRRVFGVSSPEHGAALSSVADIVRSYCGDMDAWAAGATAALVTAGNPEALAAAEAAYDRALDDLGALELAARVCGLSEVEERASALWDATLRGLESVLDAKAA